MAGLSKMDICLSNFPAEVLVYIFAFFDVESVEVAEKVCTRWEKLISTSGGVWKSLIVQLCALKPQLKGILTTKVYTDIVMDPVKLKSLYYHMSKIEENVKNSSYSVRTLNCLDAGVSKKTDWDELHNYRGVYDMIHSENRLVASVYDTIQVWDLDTYQCIQALDSTILDADGVMTTCFALRGDTLLCGTENGSIKLFDMKTGRIQANARKNSNYISDVAVNGDVMVSLDWYGEITEWDIHQPGYVVEIDSTNKFVGPMIFNQRKPERLLDYNEDHLVTTYLSHLTCYRKGEFVRSYPTKGEVFCIRIQGDLLAFGCKNERSEEDSPTAGIYSLTQEGAPAILYLKTTDKDSVISVSFSSHYLILGDVNGELHVVDISHLKFPPPGETPEVELGKENGYGVKYIGTLNTHEYGALIWAVKADSYRIFSGDETGKIIIHDYMKYQVGSAELSERGQKRLAQP